MLISSKQGSMKKSTASLPVLKLFAANTHGPLVALGDADLVAAAFNFLAGILGGVQTWRKKRQRLQVNYYDN